MKRKIILLTLGLTTQIAWAGWTEGAAAYTAGNYKAAFAEFQALANNHNAAAQFMLGLMYENGTGAIQDYKEAVEWYGRSADMRNEFALNSLGVMYELGRGGLTPDLTVAYALYNLSAALQNNVAISNRNRLLSKLSPHQIELTQNLSKAMTSIAPSSAIIEYQYEQSPAGKIAHARKQALESLGKALPKQIAGFEQINLYSGPGFISAPYYSDRNVTRRDFDINESKLARTLKYEVCNIDSVRKILQAGKKINFLFTSNQDQTSKFFLESSDCDPKNLSQPARNEFDSYPATLYQGPIIPPAFKGRNKNYSSFRTVLREGIAKGINFAGNLTLIQIGCGNRCSFIRAYNTQTGMFHEFPLGGEDNLSLSIIFQRNSRLVIASWERLDGLKSNYYQDQFIWNGKNFHNISHVELEE